MRGLVALFAFVTACSAAQFLPEIHMQGTHYDVGFAVGSAFSTQIKTFTASYDTLNKLLKWDNTVNGKRIVDEFLVNNQKAYPMYLEELAGLADGCGVPIRSLFILNLEAELGPLSGVANTKDVFGCTDILINNKLHQSISHNEDADVGIKNLAVFVHAFINDSRYPDNTNYGFNAYTYPGFLSGNTFGYNSYGLVQTTNALFPTNITTGGIARQFINRDMLRSRTVADAINAATVPNRASGFSGNLGSLYETTVVNIEVAPSDFSIVDVTNHYYHFNMYKHLNVSQTTDESTVHRETRADAMPLANTMEAALMILGDHVDKEFPIYRDGAAPDTDCVTVATAVFDITEAVLAIYVDNPLLSEPVAVYDMRY